MLRVLLVEDDLDLEETIVQFLELEGINCDAPPDSDSLKVHLHRLRKVLDAAGKPILRTIPGHGYALREDTDAAPTKP